MQVIDEKFQPNSQNLLNRIKELTRRESITITELERIIGASKGVLSRALSKGTDIQSKWLIKIVENFQQYNPEWLLTGKGSMLRNTMEKSETGGELVKLAKEKVPAPSPELQEIPVYDIRASAGLGMLFSDQSRQIPIEYLRIPYLPKADGALFVTGDSMYPLLKAGDIVIFRRVNNIPDGFIWGEIYLLDINLNGDEFVSIKYVQKSEKGDEYIKLVSHNEHHHSKDIPVSSVRTAAHVLASIRFNTML